MTTKSKSRLKVFGLESNYTPLPNVIADHIYPALGPAAAAVLGAIIRQTIGWHRQTGDISYADIQKATGIQNRNTISSALKLLTGVGLVLRTKSKGKANEYAIAAGLEVESIDDLVERIRVVKPPRPARNTSNETILPIQTTSNESILVPVTNRYYPSTTLPIEEKKETQVGAVAPSSPVPSLSPEVIARAKARKSPEGGYKDPLAEALETSSPLRKIMAVAKRGPYADQAAALVMAYFELTKQPIDKTAIERSMTPARRLAGVGASAKLVETAWETSEHGKAFAVTSLFSLEGTVRTLMGQETEAVEVAAEALTLERRWDENRKQFVMVRK